MLGVQPWCARCCGEWCPASHDLAARWWSGRGESRTLSAAGMVVVALSSWVAAASAGQAEPLAASQLSTASFIEQLDELKAAAQRQRITMDELARVRETLSRQLEPREQQRASMTAPQRAEAHAVVSDLEQAIAEVKEVMEIALADSSALSGKLESAEQQLAEVSRQRAARRQVETGLPRQVSRLEHEVRQVRSWRSMAQLWLKQWVVGSAEVLEGLFVETGVNLDQLLERVAAPTYGQGGPLQEVAVNPQDSEAALPDDPIGTDIERLVALQKLARVLPLTAPLDHFTVTSGFGKRRDPFTKGWAFHPGLDLGAAPGSAALATAPGRVIHAGPSGPYGNMVEIDHGMGVVTRYAHLKKVSVAEGDQVQSRQSVGIIGTTGRSTALHLHYEVRIDDEAYDPARFLDAGRLLVSIFANPANPADGAPAEPG
jgi:murein DD-endopeptidase MepM/ murein hydrolase activator NlpD